MTRTVEEAGAAIEALEMQIMDIRKEQDQQVVTVQRFNSELVELGYQSCGIPTFVWPNYESGDIVVKLDVADGDFDDTGKITFTPADDGVTVTVSKVYAGLDIHPPDLQIMGLAVGKVMTFGDALTAIRLLKELA